MPTPVSSPHATVLGSGFPVLALHGWTVDRRLMSGCLEPILAAPDRFRRIYPDLPGMGTNPGDGVESSDDVLAWVSDLIEAEIGAEPFVIIGESYGGYLARAITNTRPDQVRGLALLCPLVDGVPLDQRVVAPLEVRRPDPGVLATLDPAEAKEFASLAVVQSTQVLERFREQVAPGLASGNLSAQQRIQENWMLSTPPETDQPFLWPTLIVTGRQDNLVGYEQQFELLEHYPHATYVVLDQAGHNLQIERPGVWSALVADWLECVKSEQGAMGSTTHFERP